jgi:hypothetical protein
MELDDVLSRLNAMPKADREVIVQQALDQKASQKFCPSPGPQTDAYLNEADELLYGGQAGGGKGLEVNELVLTPWGWKRIGDLKVGSNICATDGTVTEVIAVYPQGERDLYRVTMQDGGSVVTDDNHLWLAWRTHANRKLSNQITSGPASARKYTTPQLMAELQKGRRGDGRKRGFAIPISDPVALNVAGGLVGPRNFVGRPIDPYLLGLILGDGYIGKAVAITTADEQTLDYLVDAFGEDATPTLRDKTWSVRIVGAAGRALRDHLDSLGLTGTHAWDKFVPRNYLWATVEDRWAILQGLMDTDGWAEPRRAVYFTSVSRQLVDDVVHLVRSLGGIASVTDKAPTYTYKGETLDGRPAWCVRVKLPNPVDAFRLERKRAVAETINHQSEGRLIESIEPAGRGESVCITVAHPNSLFITNDFIVTHNSALLCGLALTEHKRTLIMRRKGVDLEGGGGLIEELLKMYGTRDGFSGKSPQTLRTEDGRIITFGSAVNIGDEQSFQGRARDFLGVDEAAQFAESQIRFLLGWIRSEDPGQRTRAVLASNPPLDAEGLWMVQMFRPWLDPTHHNPAEPGELRWFCRTPDGAEIEVEDGTPRDYNGDVYLPVSRSFIPASLSDNPFLRDTNYKARLDAMPEPLRSAMRDGNFMLAREDAEWQIIPTQWVLEAQDRWTEAPPDHCPMSAIGVDVAQGGADQTVLSIRHDGWFAPLMAIPGVETPDGPSVAGRVIAAVRNKAKVIVDMGGGWGGSTYDHLKALDIPVSGFRPAESTVKRTKDSMLGFYNVRAQAWWQFREALDPSQQGGSPIALPPDPEVVADLTAPTYDTKTGKIKIERKEDLKKRLGRSPDKGDAIVMAWYDGSKFETHGRRWGKYSEEHGIGGKKAPKVVMSRPNARRRRQ